MKNLNQEVVITLKTDQPEILKSDIKVGLKYAIKVCQVLIDLFPTLALLESQKILIELLKGINKK